MLDTEMIVDAERLAELAPEWERLAVANAQPMMLPAWSLGWLRHLAPNGVALRAVAATERSKLVGLAPFFVEPDKRGRVDYRLLGGGLPRTSPVAVPGREWEVAEAVAAALAEASPRPDAIALESGPLASHWSAALREGWPAGLRPPAREYFVQPSLTVSLEAGSFDAWLAGKSSSFRRELRKNRRRFEEAGGSWRMTSRATLRDDVATFVRLHAGRWEGRGQSSIVAMGERMPAMLEEIGSSELEAGQFRLCVLEVEGEPAAAQLCAAAGGEVLYLNSGWDDRFAAFGPGVLAMLAALEDAFNRGERRADLGGGDQSVKARIADGNDPLAWTLLMVPGRRLPLTWLRSAPMLASKAAREAAKRVLSAEQADKLRRLRPR